jgi:multidrug efflux pump subunit AcrB
MWIVKLALRRPYTFVVMAILILVMGVISFVRTPVDIFPDINIPVISIIWNYNGLVPKDMADRIISVTERSLTTTVDNIEHIESQSLYGTAVVKVFLQPTANVERGIAQITAVSQTQLRQLPAGTTPPLILAFSASSVPVLQLALSGQGLSEQQLNDYALNFIRTQLITIPGASVPYPYGGKQRQIQVDLNPNELQSKNLSALDAVNAISLQNLNATLAAGRDRKSACPKPATCAAHQTARPRSRRLWPRFDMSCQHKDTNAITVGTRAGVVVLFST